MPPVLATGQRFNVLHLDLHLSKLVLYYFNMKKFRYIDDVKDWLEPMDYQGFWVVVEPYDLVLQTRDHCDQ